MADTALVVFLVLTALAFDFINGFHDAANAISTIVSTRGLSPRQAVLWAAFFNFIAFFLVGVPVAKTIGTGIIHADIQRCVHVAARRFQSCRLSRVGVSGRYPIREKEAA